MNPHYRYTPHHEPSLPSSSGPTTHYLAVSSSLSSSTNAVIVCHHRHCHHHGVGCCLVPPDSIIILTIVVHPRCKPTNNGFPATSPHPPPPLGSSPPCRCRALSTLLIAHGSVMDWHAAWTPSRSDAPSATPARAPLFGGRAHCASATITAAAMPWSSLRRSAVDPTSLLRPPPVRRRRRQHGNVDGHPWQPSAATMMP